MPTSFLHLWQWDVQTVIEHDTGYRVEATYQVKPGVCPKCNGVKGFYGHGTLIQQVNDTTHAGKPVVIEWTRQRFKCKACGKTILQPSNDIDDNHLMTTRLVKHIETEVLRRTFVSVANEVGVSEGTIRNVFKAYAERMEARHVFVAPELLGIDELHIRGTPRCILTNLREHTVLDFMPDRTHRHVYRSLLKLEQRNNVQVVAMDMHRPYLTVTKQVFPKAIAVVDKFHVVRMATMALDSLRKLIGKELSARQKRHIMRRRKILLARPWTLDDEGRFQLEEWLTTMPDLKMAWELKERFFDIWEHNDASSARKALHAWREAVPGHLEPIFRPLLTASTNWEDQILNYFATNGVTNAYTESVNRSLRDIDRAGRGYSFEVLRAKALYAHNAIERRKPARLHMGRVGEMASFLTQGPAIGVDVSTFAAAITAHDE